MFNINCVFLSFFNFIYFYSKFYLKEILLRKCSECFLKKKSYVRVSNQKKKKKLNKIIICGNNIFYMTHANVQINSIWFESMRMVLWIVYVPNNKLRSHWSSKEWLKGKRTRSFDIISHLKKKNFNKCEFEFSISDSFFLRWNEWICTWKTKI